MLSYLAGLIIIAGTLAIFARGVVERCASVLIVNWIAQYLFNEWAGTFTPWLFFTFIDFLSGLVILWKPAGRWQAMLAGTYAVQIICHFVYAQGGFGQHDYWQVLTSIAWAQLMILGVWGYGSYLSRLLLRWNPRGSNKKNNGGMA